MSNDDPMTIEQLCNFSDERFYQRHGVEREKANPGAGLPVTVERDMQTDPVEGEQGTITWIIEHECTRCHYDRAEHTYDTMSGVSMITCRACEKQIEAE